MSAATGCQNSKYYPIYGSYNMYNKYFNINTIVYHYLGKDYFHQIVINSYYRD